MASITFTVQAQLQHVQGKFVSKDELAEQLQEALDAADPGEVYVDESLYSVDEWNVEAT